MLMSLSAREPLMAHAVFSGNKMISQFLLDNGTGV